MRDITELMTVPTTLNIASHHRNLNVTGHSSRSCSMQDEEPVLPEWVQTLIEAEKEKSYDKGRADGIRWAFELAEGAIRNVAGRAM